MSHRQLKSEGPIHISSVALQVLSHSAKTIDHFTLRIGSIVKEIAHELSPGLEYKEAFKSAIELSPDSQLSVQAHCRSRWLGKNTFSIHIQHSDIVQGLQDDGHGIKKFMYTHKNILLTIVTAANESRHDSPVTPPSESVWHPSPSPPDPIPDSVDDAYGDPVAERSYPDPEVAESSPNPPISLTAGPQPATDEILRICPRFRLLVVGNTGVGKSSLIQKVFGVKEVVISDDSRGLAHIDREFVAAENGLFVVHDSVGLEAGEGKNFNEVKRFIRERRKQKEMKDRLHAVWVCLAVPYAKGRLLEAGMEEFLKNRREILGDIPLVVVLTKVDLLDNLLLRTLRNEGVEFKTIAEAAPNVNPRRSEFIKQYCTQPLLRITGGDTPHVAVSTASKYGLEGTIPELVKLTTSEIRRYIEAGLSRTSVTEPQRIGQTAPLYVAEMAQRASIESKVNLTIEIGKKSYWRHLGASVNFSEEKVKQYLGAIHQDILQVWNFNDNGALKSDDFRVALLNISDLEVQESQESKFEPNISFWSAFGGDPASAAIALPVVGVLALAQTYKKIRSASTTITKRFMAYIVDLIYVMRILFILAPDASISPQQVVFAVDTYSRSKYRNLIHCEIRHFNTDLVSGRNEVMTRIEVLVRRFNITDEDVSNQRGQSAPSHGASGPSRSTQRRS